MVDRTLKDIFDRNKFSLDTAGVKSRAWYQKQVNELKRKNVTPSKLLRNEVSQLTTRIRPGELYMYLYDPKMKDVLPYYDTFPLVFPFGLYSDGFIGINLHYIPYMDRMILLSELIKFRNTKEIQENTRLKLSWELISNYGKMRVAQPCVKRYLYSQVGGPFKKVMPEDWSTVMLLPVEQFVKSNKNAVWRDSRNKIR